jgi:hypothetical protein
MCEIYSRFPAAYRFARAATNPFFVVTLISLI